MQYFSIKGNDNVYGALFAHFRKSNYIFMSYAHALELLLYVYGLFYILLYLIANSLRGIYMTQYEFTYILYLVLYLTHLHWSKFS